MDQNNKKKNNANNKNSNWRGVAALVGWALLLTILISYATSYMNGAGNQSSTVTLDYSEFVSMVESGEVDSVDFSNSENILIITPKDGYTYTDEDGTALTKATDAKNQT